MTQGSPSLRSKANPQRLEAILTTDGPVLIIAGPGSGKTFTLVERIVHLITQKGVAPESQFVVTFKDKAARELTTRISNRLTELDIRFNLYEMYLGTFHSIRLRLLEDYREFARLKRKADNQIEDAVVQAKKDFAQQIAVASGMEYQIIKSTDADNRRYRVLLQAELTRE